MADILRTITVDDYRRGGEARATADRLLSAHGYSLNEVAEIRIAKAFVEFDLVRRGDAGEIRQRTVRLKVGCPP